MLELPIMTIRRTAVLGRQFGVRLGEHRFRWRRQAGDPGLDPGVASPEAAERGRNETRYDCDDYERQHGVCLLGASHGWALRCLT